MLIGIAVDPTVGKTSPEFASDFVERETASSPCSAAQNELLCARSRRGFKSLRRRSS